MRKTRIKIVFALAILVASILSIVGQDTSSKFASSFESITPSISNDQIWAKKQIKSESVQQKTPPVSLDADWGNPSGGEIEGGEQALSYKVVRVVDGDTFDVDIEGKIERLRMIGIDTPETVDPRKSVQCFGKEASNKAKELLTGQFVNLENDPTQGDRDKYGRLLRYAFLPDGTSYGLYMISEGYAHEYTYRIPYKYQTEFKQAQAEARDNNRGLWSPGACPQKQ